MKKHIVIALAVVSLILGLVISCEEPQVNLPTQYSTPTIKGTLSIPTSQNVSASEVYVKVIDSDGNTVTVQKANADGTFVVQNLNANKKYSVLFTSVEPEFTNRAVGGSSGVGGWLYDVVPAVQEGFNVGNVKLKPLGTIKGKAVISGETEHYDITVYIPGTSYIAKTDKDGSFSIYNVPEGKYTLRYTLDDHLPVMVNDVMLVCPEDVEKPEVKVKKVTLKSSLGSVDGRAILGDSNDSTGIKVNLESEDKSHAYPAFTSKDGYYTISGIQPGRYRVIVSYEGYTSQMSSYFEVASGTLTKIDTLIELYSSSGYLNGTVSLNDSDTKSGLAVTIRSKDNGNTFTVMSDVGGAFTKRLKPGTYTVDFSHSGYSSYSVDATVVENNTTTLSAVTLYSVYGTIVGRSFSAEETVTLIDRNGNPIQTLQSSNDCTYKFSGIQSGTYSIKFSKTGFSSNTISDVVVTPSKTTTINGVELKSLYGTLKGVAGSEGDSVSLMKDGVVVETVTVDTNKTYIFTGIEPGSYSVRFSREGYTPYESETVAVAAASETTINGKILISIYGTIVGTSYSENETVSLIKDGTVLKTVVTTDDGSYSFTSVDPGTYKVRFSKDGYTSYESEEVTVLAGIESTVNGKALVSIYGTIKGTSASEGETVYLVRNGVQIKSATTLESKEYVFSEIEPGEYSVRFTKNGYKTYESEAITVKAGESYVIDGQKLISMYGAVAGFVFLSGSDDYSGVTVTLTSSESITSSFVETTAADGSFRFSDIRESGTYLLTYSKDGYVTDNTKSVEVTVGSVASAGAVTLKSTVATVKGNVQLEGASTYENTTILLKNESTQYTATTDQKGGYIINRVLPGTYILYASKDGYVSAQSNEIVIEPSSDKEVELLSLSVAIKSVTGSVELELASDYSGVLVTATNLSDNTLIYSAITNSSGDFTLAGMKSGEYSIVLSCNGYNTVTLPTINVVNTTVYNLDKQNLEISRGKIAGLVKLEGYTDHSGVKVSILGTDYTSFTNADGSFEFNVPAANYPGGLRFEKEDMETTAYAETVPVLVNSTYALKHEIEMKAVNVPVVSGIVKVGGTDNWEGVTVTIVEKPEFSFTTGKDGAWKFEHVPLGKYTLEYTRENAKKVTSVLNVVAASNINVPTLEIIPDSASIEGWVSLDKLSDNSGVKVSVVTSETDKVLETTTDSSGYFYIGNLLSTGTHTVSFTKKGWNSVERTVSDLLPLSVTNITESDGVVLTDTTAPVISSAYINNNANSTGSRSVSVSVDAVEEGSGIAYYQITWNGDFSASEWLKYTGTIETTIPDTTNGEKSVSVKLKDGVGNVSEIKSDTIDLVGQIRSVSGYLSVEDLHWTKDNNPYVVTDDLIIPEGRTLTIDPGVDVLFDGNYSILVRGDLHAVGTEDEPIVFRSSRDYMSSDYADDDYSGYNGYWGGISAGNNTLNFNNNKNGYDYTFVSGSIISNCIISDISTGISGNIFIENSKVVSYRDAIGNNESNGFKGVIIGSEIHGNVYPGERSIAYGNKFTATEPDFSDFLYETYHSVGQNYDYYYWYDDNGNYHDTYTKFLNANNFHVLGNNYIDGYQVRIYNYNSDSILSYNTFNNCWFNELCFYNNAINNCEFVNITKTITFSEINKMSFCNIVDCANEIVFRTNRRYTDKSTIDFQYNYWGKANTEQLKNLEKNSKNKNVSFLYDGYDNIDLSVIDWSGFVEEAWPTCGYQEDGLDNFNATVIKQVSGTEEVKIGSDISFDLRMSSGEYVSEYRISQSINSLVNKNWSSYYGECKILAEEIDYDSISDGWLTFFIQGRDSSGKDTEIISIKVGCGAPVFTSFSIEEGETFTNDDSQSIHGNIMNRGIIGYNYLITCEIFVDDNSLWTSTVYDCLWENDCYIYPERLKNGEHTVKVVLTDAVGDSSTKIVKFNVDRPVPIVQSVKYSSTTLGLEDTLEVSVQVLNAKHLKSIKVKSGDREISSKIISDNGVSYVEASFSIDGWRVGEGANDIYIELEDYSGNIVKSASETITSDNTRPAFISYTINDNGDDISYSASVKNTLHLKEIRLVSDGKVVGVNRFADNGELSVSVENSVERWMLNDGVHNIWIEAVDYADNITSSEKKQITVSGTDFVVQSYDLTKDRFEATLDFVIENAEHLKEISVYADGNLVGYELFNNYGDCTVTSSVTIDTWKLKDGNHTLRIEIVDYSERREVIDNIELVVADVNPYVKSFVANVVEDTIEIDLSLSNTKHIDYLCIYVDERCEYDWLNDESVVYDAERHYVLETNNINVGQHSVYAQIRYKDDTYINTEKYYVKTALYEPRISSLTFDKTNLSADDNLKIDLSIINARHVEWIAVCSDYEGNYISYESFSNNGVGQISKSISIPSGFIGRNGKHTVWVEVKKYGSDDTIKSRKAEITLDDVEPRATKLEARENGDNIVLDISAVNMKGASHAEVYVDENITERFDLSGSSTWEKSITFEKWRLGDGEHTFAVHVGSGEMMSNELGRTSINVSGVDPTIDSFTVSKDVDYVTSKLMVSNAEHIVYMRVLYDGQEQNTYSYDEGENTSLIQITKIDVSALGDGEHKIKFRLTDSIGRDYETEERTVTLTGTKPEISKCDVEVVEDQIKLDIKVDNAYRIYLLRTYLDGEILREEYVYDKRSESYEETWFINVKDKDPGLHAFRVEVVDYGWNNYIKTPYVEVNFIKYVPLFESVSMDKNSLTSDETVTVNFTINNIKYINRIDITCDGRNVYTENVQSNSESKATTIERSIKLDSWKLGDGDHSIVVSVTENDEKVTSSESMSISVEGSLVEITSFETSQTDELLKFNISLIRTEHLKEVRVVSDGNVVVSENYENGAISSLDKVFSIEKWKLGDGEHTVYVEAEDYAGNVIKTEETSVNVSGENIGVSSFTITGVEDLIKLNLGLSNASHLKTIRTYVDGQSIKTENFIDKGPSIYSYEYSINKYTLQDGNHRFRMDIEDYNGNRIKTEELVFVITGTEAKLISYSVERIEDEIVFSGELNHTNGVGSYNYFFDSSYLTGEYRDGNTKFSKSFNFDRIDNGNHRFFMEINFVNGSTIRTKDTILNIYDYKPVITECSLNKTDVNMLEDFDLTLSLLDTKHLKEIRVISNGSTLYSKSFDDNGNGSYDSVITLNSRYFTTGTYDIVVEVEDYKENIASKNLELNVVSNEDNGPEIVNFGLVDGTEYTENNVQVFDFSINDDGGVKTIDVTLDGVTSLYHFEADAYRDSYKSIPVTLRLRLPYFINGEHKLSIRTTDFAGNETSLEKSFVVTKSLPKVDIYKYSGEYSDYCIYGMEIDDASWVYDVAFYVDDAVYYYYLLNRGNENTRYGTETNLYFDSLSEGEHEIYVKVRMQSGEEIVTNPLILAIDREVDKTKYGKDVTWDIDGTLIDDSSTLLLWDFDSDNPAYETVNGEKLGNVYNTDSGIGNGTSGRLYVDKNMRLQFPNSTWTFEYWAKNNSEALSSKIYCILYDVLVFDNWRYGSGESSIIGVWPYYENMSSEVDSTSLYSNNFARRDSSEWHHYAIVSTGTGFEVYVDGIRRRFTEGDKPSVRVSTGIRIEVPEGAYIDELRISDKARTVDELWDYVQYVRENNLLP